MKNRLKLLVWLFALSGPLAAQSVSVNGPDGKLQLTVSCPSANGEVSYAVTYNGKQMLESSPLGMETNVGDFYRGLQLKEHKVTALDTVYEQSRIKASRIHYWANELLCSFVNGEGKNVQITFRVSNNDVAFRYTLPREQGKGSVTVNSERTGFRFPSQTTTFLCPQSDAMIGWKRTKPSYEEEYKADAPMNERSGYGHGYTFPCLFKVGDDGWVLLSETGVDSRYCGSRLSDWDNGVYRIAFPMPEENNGNGTVSPAFSLPGSTPWRTVTVGETLKPIVETTVPWDVVEPRYTTTHDYKPGRGTWSWILWQDGSINYDDQVRYVDLAAAMGYEYVLIDNWWDNNIGRDRMEQFIKYARSKGVEVFLWYSSSGYWNDIEQSPVNRMDNSIARKQEMRWLQSLGVKVTSESSHEKCTSCALPCGNPRSARKFTVLPSMFTDWVSTPFFHFFRFPTRHSHEHEPVDWNEREYSCGSSGSRQNTSMSAPVSFLKCKRACITRVLLNTSRLSAGNTFGSS